MLGLLATLLLVAIGVVIVIAVQRSVSKREDPSGATGADIIAYLVLALSMGVAGFSLANLAATAFPGETFVFDPAEEVATSLSALVVSTPFLIYFWRRQARRRATYPASAGWTLYLAIVEVVFMTAFVISTVLFLDRVFQGDVTSAWTGMIVFGAIVAFHEHAARVTPPHSDAAELHRVIGSAIGLITATIGLIGVLAGVIGLGVEGLGGSPRDTGFQPWLAMLIVGAPIWWYRWLRPWDAKPSLPRVTWTAITTTAALSVWLGAAAGILVMVVEALFAETTPSGRHFEMVHLALALVLTGLGVWVVHRRALGAQPRNAYLFYVYFVAALGLTVAVSMAIALTISTFNETLIVGRSATDVITFAVVLAVGSGTWLVLERRGVRAEDRPGTMSWPRRLYTLGVGALFGLVAAGALIIAIFVLLRRVLADSESGSLLEPVTVLVYTGLAAFYLLRLYAAERGETQPGDVVAPFQVTIICAHPGMIAAKFPAEARLRVLHHDNPAGVITEEMADEIVQAVSNHPSFVWVDGDGFRIAPMRAAT
jgi:hypothetical protein